MAEQIVSDNVKHAYDEFYNKHDEAWRMLGAKFKAQHIIDVCRGHNFKRVLEVGAGDGSILKLLAEQNFAPEYHAVEISESGVEHIKARNITNLKSVSIFDFHFCRILCPELGASTVPIFSFNLCISS